jgi:endonuclease YncB( thermonuclease family)
MSKKLIGKIPEIRFMPPRHVTAVVLAVLLGSTGAAMGQPTQPEAKGFVQFQAKKNNLDRGAKSIAGQASVIDGDTIEVAGQRVRLWGIDAPESDQLCRGSDSLPYRCGSTAANALADKIGRSVVICEPRAIDRYKRTVATCVAVGVDLARWLVRSGLALDWPQYSRGAYASDQASAARDSAGMFAGSYVSPWDYRACRQAGGASSAAVTGIDLPEPTDFAKWTPFSARFANWRSLRINLVS